MENDLALKYFLIELSLKKQNKNKTRLYHLK